MQVDQIVNIPSPCALPFDEFVLNGADSHTPLNQPIVMFDTCSQPSANCHERAAVYKVVMPG